MKKQTILVPEVVAEPGLQYLREHGLELKMTNTIAKEDLIRDLEGCVGAIVRVGKYDADVLSHHPQIKVLGKHGVGVDSIDLAYCKEHGIRVVNTPQANSLSVAEHTMTLMLACLKQIPFKAKRYALEDYAVKDRLLGHEISGKILGLIGYGHIGRLVARMARNGFSMDVLAYDPFVPEGINEEGVEVTHSQDRVYQAADIVSIHIPATKDTIRSIGENQFKMMKPSAIIVNTARGSVINEQELIEALRHGEIAGAALDVSDPEPAKKDNPLHSMDQVIMTPHCAAVTVDAMNKMSLDVAKGIIEVLSDQEPTWPVI
ncbi:MAG: hydroxyacid dehydrogenase [Christensenellales bacterium]|jgi:D-3-phosphoglycerate dehydrogenase